MAKFERSLKGNFRELLEWLNNDIKNGSSSASYEDGSDININGMNCAVRVYERYSMAGGNRVSLNITVVGYGEELFISAITSGGSQAIFFKINTWGEETFLEACRESVENYIQNYKA
jgi:hypothetical protein